MYKVDSHLIESSKKARIFKVMMLGKILAWTW